MEKISKILAPTDFSKLSQAGVRCALELAKAVKAEVTVYHVVNLGELKLTGGPLRNGSLHSLTQCRPTGRLCPGS